MSTEQTLIFGFDLSYESALEAARLVESVKALESNAEIGFALNCVGKGSTEIAEAFRNFGSVADFLAIDMSAVENEAALYSEVERVKDVIENYNLRIIISEPLVVAREGLRARGYFNWQIVP